MARGQNVVQNVVEEDSASPERTPPPRRRRVRRRSRSPRTAGELAAGLGLTAAQADAIRAILSAPNPPQQAPQELQHQPAPPPQEVVPYRPAGHQRGGAGGRGAQGRGGGQGRGGAARGGAGRGGVGPWVIWGMRLPSYGPYTAHCRRHGTPNCQNCIYYSPVEEF